MTTAWLRIRRRQAQAGERELSLRLASGWNDRKRVYTGYHPDYYRSEVEAVLRLAGRAD